MPGSARASTSCNWPTVTVPGLVEHHRIDGREIFQEGGALHQNAGGARHRDRRDRGGGRGQHQGAGVEATRTASAATVLLVANQVPAAISSTSTM